VRRFGPGRANDGVIHGVTAKGAIDYKGWSYGGNLQHAQFLIAFDRACAPRPAPLQREQPEVGG
jgi:hypothetical protein